MVMLLRHRVGQPVFSFINYILFLNVCSLVNYKVGKLLMTRAGWLWLCCPDTGQPVGVFIHKLHWCWWWLYCHGQAWLYTDDAGLGSIVTVDILSLDRHTHASIQLILLKSVCTTFENL